MHRRRIRRIRRAAQPRHARSRTLEQAACAIMGDCLIPLACPLDIIDIYLVILRRNSWVAEPMYIFASCLLFSNSNQSIQYQITFLNGHGITEDQTSSLKDSQKKSPPSIPQNPNFLLPSLSPVPIRIPRTHAPRRLPPRLHHIVPSNDIRPPGRWPLPIIRDIKKSHTDPGSFRPDDSRVMPDHLLLIIDPLSANRLPAVVLLLRDPGGSGGDEVTLACWLEVGQVLAVVTLGGVCEGTSDG
jgi:hypothetical protein